MGTKLHVVIKARNSVVKPKFTKKGDWGGHTRDPAQHTPKWGTRTTTTKWKTWEEHRNSVTTNEVVIGLTYLGVVPIRDREQGKKNFRYVKVVEVLSNKKIKVEDVVSEKPYDYDIADISRIKNHL